MPLAGLTRAVLYAMVDVASDGLSNGTLSGWGSGQPSNKFMFWGRDASDEVNATIILIRNNFPAHPINF